MTLLVGHFKGNHSLHVPSQKDEWRNYRRTEESVLQWHEGFSLLQSRIADGTGILEALKGDELSLLPSEAEPTGVTGSTASQPRQAGQEKFAQGQHAKRRSKNQQGQNTNEKSKRQHDTSFEAELRRRKARWAGERLPRQSQHGRSTEQLVDAAGRADKDSGATPENNDMTNAPTLEMADDGHDTPADNASTAKGLFGLQVRDHAVDATWLSAFLTVFVLLLAAAYVSQSPSVAAIAFVLNCMFLLLLYRAKMLNDAVSGCVEALRLAQVRLAGVFASYSSTEMVAQSLCLRKIDIIADFWESHMYGVRLPIPVLGQVAVDTNLLLSVTIPNMLGLLQLMLSLFQSESGAHKTKAQTRSVLQHMWGLCLRVFEGGDSRSNTAEHSPHHTPTEAAAPSEGAGRGGSPSAEVMKVASALQQSSPLANAAADARGGSQREAPSQQHHAGIGGFTAAVSF